VSVLDLRALLGTLNEHGVDYVVIGGVAVAAHGYVRATRDLDIVPEPSGHNADRLARALASMGATLTLGGGRPFRPAGDVTTLRRRRNMTLDTRHGALDVVQAAPGVPSYAALEERSKRSDLLGVPVRVCSLDDLREMKMARGSDRDQLDLSNLPPASASPDRRAY
jgi:hypothetical protein